ncbi:hypothetical protein BDN72DRAFT_96611 [Pluteus cervinus]|uniref:Uncharacterized protein n=1 Tax=Pluteus cervinus TaxID=181527 RepID=A0ACD3AQ24_9AGAR|nr:hypothetical protein BDN72DRAFT_96611 [Pluteus cervinus]
MVPVTPPSNSSRYLVIAIYDIALTICEELANDLIGRATLVAVARSSRILSEAALAALWQNIPDAGPLIRTLPEDCWERESVTWPDEMIHVFLI